MFFFFCTHRGCPRGLQVSSFFYNLVYDLKARKIGNAQLLRVVCGGWVPFDLLIFLHFDSDIGRILKAKSLRMRYTLLSVNGLEDPISSLTALGHLDSDLILEYFLQVCRYTYH